jgi:ParB/RepB/Spo0J family partition protein
MQRAEAVRNIPLDLLDANPRNPRKSFDAGALSELAASIQVAGITVPLLVRPAPNMEGIVEPRYEIVAGHRRFEAATNLGLETAPCIVRPLTDAEAADLALIDNLQRADVPALEEAEAFGELLSRLGSAEAVAARVGKDVAHIAKRLRLLMLGENSRTALREQLITVDHALLLARLGADDEEAALKWCLDRTAGSTVPVEKVMAAAVETLAKGRANRYMGRYWEPESVPKLKDHIEQTGGRKLAKAPWGLDDATLVPVVGACDVCPQNTRANAALFADLDIEEATCADGVCFESKRAAFVHRRKNEVAVARGGNVASLSWKMTAVAPRLISLGDKGGDDLAGGATVADVSRVLKVGQWVAAKPKSCATLVPGVTVDWKADAERDYGLNAADAKHKPGEELLVCIGKGCKTHPKEYEKPKDGCQGSGGYDRKAEEEKAAKLKAASVEENKIRMFVASNAVAAVKTIPAEALRAIAIAAFRSTWLYERVQAAIIPGLKKTLQSAPVMSAEFAQALALVSLEELAASERLGAGESGRKDFLASVKRIGYDGAGMWKNGGQPSVVSGQSKPAAKKKAAVKAGNNPVKTGKKLAPVAKRKLTLEARKRIAVAMKNRAKGGGQ